MKRSLLIVLLLVVMITGGLFSDTVTDAQYNEPGQVNLTAVVGLNVFGLSVGAGAELIMGDLDFIPEFPMEWGLAARGVFGFYLLNSYTGTEYGAAPLATLHKGFDFGDNLEFDFTIGLGLGLYGYNYGYLGYTYAEPINVGFASFDSVSWKMSETMWLTLEYSYIGRGSVYGAGVRIIM